ncbi:MAG TPA: hypothetical protein VLA89_00285 [Gemmatimonadales bacterium]|nr:hypothetical protein [Gemmatimonadales bacterium]
MIRLGVWCEKHCRTISWVYIRMGALFGVFALFDTTYAGPAICFGMVAIWLRKDDLVHAVRSLDDTG